MRHACLGLATVAAALFCAAPLSAQQPSDPDRFAGFPPIGVHRPGERTLKTITSDGVTGLVRPKWTRAMGDLGAWPTMFRFKDGIYLEFQHTDGHRYKQFEATGKVLYYVSKDEGRSWTLVPNDFGETTGEFVVAGEKLFRYDFEPLTHSRVRTSTDAVHWSEAVDIYKPPFFFWGVMYDPASETFWAPPHAIPHKGVDPARQIHLVRSKDGIQWDYVSTVAPFNNCSESVLRFEPDRTMVVLVRRKYGSTASVMTAPPPYDAWTESTLPMIVEGEHFFEIGDQTFLASRASYQGENAEVNANPAIFDKRKSYSAIYHWTEDRQLAPWAVMDSMGDCSYPFLVETPTEILCAYYSQHEDGVCKVFLCGYDKAEFLAP